MTDKNNLIWAMKQGDWEFLAAHVEAGGNIDKPPGLRKFLAEIIRGTATRSANRPPGLKKQVRQYHIAQHGSTAKALAEQFNMDRSSADRAIKAYKRALEENPQSIISLWLYQRGYY